MSRVSTALAVFAMMACTMMGATNLIVEGDWQMQLVVLTAVILTIMTLAMAIGGSSHRGVAGVVAVVVSILVWIGHLVGVTTHWTSVLPNARGWSTLVEHLREAVVTLPDYGRPANNPDLFFPLALLGLGPMVVLAGLVAIIWSRPRWVGVIGLACWSIFLTGSPSSGLGWALASTVFYLMAVATSRRPDRVSQPKPTALVVAVLAGAVGLMASTVAPTLPGWGRSSTWVSFWNRGYTDLTGVDIHGALNVGDALRTQSDQVLFRTQGTYASALKVGSYTRFDGGAWQPDDGDLAPYPLGLLIGDMVTQSTTQSIDAESGHVNVSVDASPAEQWWAGGSTEVVVDHLSGDALPTAIGPRAVSNIDPLQALAYDTSQGAIVTERELSPGVSYVVQTYDLDRTGLSEREVSYPLPQESWGPLSQWGVKNVPGIFDLVSQIVAGATTQDQMLMAIQNYLRGPGFSYTLSPAWVSQGDPVWDFLTNKQGYCVHYATAMAVLARAVGIPMRVSAGYLPGRPDADNQRVVTGGDAHLWPEAFFPGLGWVPYEPTPGIGASDGAATTPTDAPSAVRPSATGAEPVPAPSPSAVPSTNPALAGPPGSWWSQHWATVAVVVAVAVGLAGLGGLAWLVWIGSYTPERAWRRIRAVGISTQVLSPGTTIRAGVATLAGSVAPSRAEDLSRLRDQLEARRYDLPGGGIPATSPRWTWRLTRDVIRAAKASAAP